MQSNDIYIHIQQQIQSVLEVLKSQTPTDETREAIEQTLRNLDTLNNKIQEEYEQLKKFSEWKKFTIAFYGETNAGKSTTIEALRLYLKEPQKLEEQKQFKEIQERMGITHERFTAIEKIILDSEKELGHLQVELRNLSKKFDSNRSTIKTQIEQLTALLAEKKARQSWWQKIINVFSKLPEEYDLQKAHQSLVMLEKTEESEKISLNQLIQSTQNQVDKANTERASLQEATKALEHFKDGKIIGDGRSDFTRNNTSFDFTIDDKEVTLIDVPGIEGKEHEVKKPILEAVTKAHAVFYVTRTPRPPQTHEGEKDNRQGTLEKIKQHLASQTEIWTIYNHPTPNYRQLRTPLIDEGTQQGINDLDSILRKNLGEQYQGTIILAARPAYLALTECTIPGQTDARDQQKFLEKLSRDEILNLSGLKQFIDTLKNEIIKNYPEKIQHSNLNKATRTLKNTLEEITSNIKSLTTSRNSINKEVRHAQAQLNTTVEQLEGLLISIQKKVIQKFGTYIENEVGEKIDSDINKDELKEYLEIYSELGIRNLSESLAFQIEKALIDFQADCERIIKRSQEHLINITHKQNSLTLNTFHFELNIDNGLQTVGMIGSAIGLITSVALLIGSGGAAAIIAAVAGIISGIIGGWKAIRGFFDSDYKKAQQYEAMRKSISKTKVELEQNIEQHLDQNILQPLKKQMETIKENLKLPIKEQDAILHTLKEAQQQLSLIERNIHL